MFSLAEGPFWDAKNQHALWVDIPKGQVHIGSIQSDSIAIHRTLQFDGTIGAVVSAEDGSLLVAAAKHLIRVLNYEKQIVGPRIVPEDIHSRTNDGKVDPQGRFVIGTLSLDDRVGQERLLRLEHDGSLTVIDDDAVLSNGLAWSNTGETMFNIDSGKHVIWQRSYSAGPEQPGPRREFARIEDGYPDGMTIDEAGNLWVAVWGRGEVRCFAPDGSQIATIATGAPNTTSCAFVGEKLDRLLITTASVELTEIQLAESRQSGALLLADVGVSGVPANLWAVNF